MLGPPQTDGVGMERPAESALGDDGAAHVTLLGEIDFSNADEVAQALRDAVADWSPPVVRVDLRAATFIDSTGLGALIEGYRAAAERDSRFVVLNPSPSFRRVLTVTGLCELFGMVEPEERTDESFSSATGA
jgi:anti-sigma B factor antagonist